MSGFGVAQPLLLALVLLAGASVMVVLRSRPVLVLVTWLGGVCLVPVWVTLPLGPLTLEPQSLVALVCLAASVPLGSRVRDALTVPDVLMAAVVVAGLLGVVVGSWSLDSVLRLGSSWLVAYLLGRLLRRRVDLVVIYRGIAIAFTVVAVLALVEAASGVNVFVQLPGSAALRDAWGTIQVRGGVSRAEGAFGHSIALGGCLATAVPITLVARWRPLPTLVAVALMAGAAVVTFSRIGMLTLALGVVLTLAFLASGLSVRLRVSLAAVVTVGALAVVPLVTRVFGAAGDEATNSAAYRGDLLALVGDARWLGLATTAYRAPDGRVWFGTFRSIDNALLLMALSTGLITVVCVLLALLWAGIAVVSRRATAPTIALVSQVPAFATVALITQYAAWVWFLAGLAVASQVAARVASRDATTVGPTALTRPGDTAPVDLPRGAHPADASEVDSMRGTR